MQPFDVLGGRTLADGTLEAGAGPEPSAPPPPGGDTVVVVVDPAGLHHIAPPGGPADCAPGGAYGLSARIYAWLGIAQAKRFPWAVTSVVRAVGDAALHAYTLPPPAAAPSAEGADGAAEGAPGLGGGPNAKGRRLSGPKGVKGLFGLAAKGRAGAGAGAGAAADSRAHVIHAVGPDLRRLHEPLEPPYSREEAVALLARTYGAALGRFAEGFDRGAAPRVRGVRAPLLPLSRRGHSTPLSNFTLIFLFSFVSLPPVPPAARCSALGRAASTSAGGWPAGGTIGRRPAHPLLRGPLEGLWRPGAPGTGSTHGPPGTRCKESTAGHENPRKPPG